VVAQSHDFDSLMLFDFRSGKWSKIASGSYIHFPQWSHDGRYVFYQDLRTSEDQPIYRLEIASRRVEKVAGREQILPDDFSNYRLVALTPDDQPVISLIRYDSDVYALDLDLP
jgi:hypothetical protein